MIKANTPFFSSLFSNPLPNLNIFIHIRWFGHKPEHQQGIRCKAPMSDLLRRISNTPQGCAIEGNAADDTLMVDQDF